MGADVWPCSTCDAPGVQNFGASGHCTTHLTELLRGFDASVWALNGRWIQTGCIRPDHGYGFAECECPACGASAVAVVGSSCAYCEHARQRLADWQTEIVLRPPDHDVDDPRRDAALRGWAERLAVAVDAELITETEARRVWEREVGHVAA